MNQVKLFLIIFLHLPMFPHTSFGNNAVSELENIGKLYVEVQNIYAEISMISYADHNRQNLLENYKAKYIKNEEKLYIKSMGIETLNDGQYFILADHNTKLLILQKNTINTQNKEFIEGILEPGTMMTPECEVQMRVANDGNKILRFYNNDKRFEYYEIRYEPETYKLKEITVFYSVEYINSLTESADENENMLLLVIRYDKLEFDTKNKEEVLLIDRFVKKQGNEWVPVKSFQNYEFIGRHVDNN